MTSSNRGRPLRVAVVIGTRPEAIKMAPLILQAAANKEIELQVCVTGQHEDMMDQVISDFQLTVTYRLNAMRESDGVTGLLGFMIRELGKYFADASPDVVLVHGDTASTLAGALAAFYSKIPVGHVEAGLRTPSIASPWPEEGNRRLVSKISSIHFAPTELNAKALLAEGHPKKDIFVTGNTVVDALILGLQFSKNKYESVFDSINKDERQYRVSNRNTVLITAHRRENHGKNFESICDAIEELSANHRKWDFVFPVHPNPHIRDLALQRLDNRENIFLLEPQNYLKFLILMSESNIILSDSGGIQEEGPSIGKPVLVLRDTTERMEAVHSGHIHLIGTAKRKIIEHVDRMIGDEQQPVAPANKNPFGDGRASQKILEIVLSEFAS